MHQNWKSCLSLFKQILCSVLALCGYITTFSYFLFLNCHLTISKNVNYNSWILL